MSLTQNIADMVKAANHLTDEVSGKIEEIDASLSQALADTKQAINRLNEGDLERLKLEAMTTSLELGAGDNYRKYFRNNSGESTDGEDKWIPFFSLTGGYAGHVVDATIHSYNRGNTNGISSKLNIHFVKTTEEIDNSFLVITFGDESLQDYIKVFDDKGNELDVTSGARVYLPFDTVITINFLMKQYHQMSSVIESYRL